MLDVLHYYFEENFSHVSLEHAQRISSVRESTYQSLYGVDYPYSITREAGGNSQNIEDYDVEDLDSEPEEIKVFNPKSKPYTPPTKLNESAAKPFGSILDAPLG